MTRLVATVAATALLAALSVALSRSDAAAADQRYVMAACGGAKPCVFVLDSQTGEVRYCDTAGCRVLDAAAAAENPSPFPFGNQLPDTASGEVPEPFPLGEMGTPGPSVVDQLNRAPAEDDDASPFPYVEPAPQSQ